MPQYAHGVLIGVMDEYKPINSLRKAGRRFRYLNINVEGNGRFSKQNLSRSWDLPIGDRNLLNRCIRISCNIAWALAGKAEIRFL
jgi:hypothetical protein